MNILIEQYVNKQEQSKGKMTHSIWNYAQSWKKWTTKYQGKRSNITKPNDVKKAE